MSVVTIAPNSGIHYIDDLDVTVIVLQMESTTEIRHQSDGGNTVVIGDGAFEMQPDFEIDRNEIVPIYNVYWNIPETEDSWGTPEDAWEGSGYAVTDTHLIIYGDGVETHINLDLIAGGLRLVSQRLDHYRVWGWDEETEIITAEGDRIFTVDDGTTVLEWLHYMDRRMDISAPYDGALMQLLGRYIYDANVVYGGTGTENRDLIFGRETIVHGLGGNDVIFAESAAEVYGGEGDDVLNGSAGAETLFGGDGNDRLYSAAGVFGVPNNDVLFGGEGDDRLFGDDGNDQLYGGAGDDYLTTNDGPDGFEGADLLDGGDGNDTLHAGAGDDTLLGGDGDDKLDGGSGIDTLEGGAGNDTLYGTEGAGSFFGGSGSDYVSYLDSYIGVTVDLANAGENTGDAAGDLYSDIENIQGSENDDILRGDGGVNIILGEDGNDVIEGRSGSDRLFGGAGDDALHGGIGYDTLSGGMGADALYGGSGLDYASYLDASAGVTVDFASVGSNAGDAAGDSYTDVENIQGSAHSDVLRGDDGANVISGEAGSDRVEGGGGNDRLYGAAGADRVFGGEGVDALYGGLGYDTLNGGVGADALYGGAGVDYASYLGAGASVTVDLASLDANTGEAAGDTYTSVENIQGSIHNDMLRGDDSVNVISGEAGDDVVEGRGGNDRLYGAAGNDQLFGGEGDDQLFGGAGSDTLSGGAGRDTFVFNARLAVGGPDHISDFVATEDMIQLDDAVFSAIAIGALSASAFSATGEASTAKHRILYDSQTGGVYYDADGNGDRESVLIFSLLPNTTLTQDNFVIV